MRATDGSVFFNNDPGGSRSAGYTLEGGAYVMDLVAGGTGSVTLKRLGPDLVSYIAASTATTMTATGTSGAVVLPAGVYIMDTTGLTGVYASLIRVAGE